MKRSPHEMSFTSEIYFLRNDKTNSRFKALKRYEARSRAREYYSTTGPRRLKKPKRAMLLLFSWRKAKNFTEMTEARIPAEVASIHTSFFQS